MPIPAKAAAEIARRHGLNLSDAAALAQLADTDEGADELAAAFAEPSAAEIAKKVPRI